MSLSRRFLNGAEIASDSMTVETCLAFCDSLGFKYAGLEYSRECCKLEPISSPHFRLKKFVDCGNFFENLFESVSDSECTMACAGDPSEICGGPSRLSRYESPRALPVMKQTVGDWNLLGCVR